MPGNAALGVGGEQTPTTARGEDWLGGQGLGPAFHAEPPAGLL